MVSNKKPETPTNNKGRSRISLVRTRGPVSNLEEHVPPDWWARIFNSMYLKTDGDVVDDQWITTVEIDRFC